MVEWGFEPEQCGFRDRLSKLGCVVGVCQPPLPNKSKLSGLKEQLYDFRICVLNRQLCWLSVGSLPYLHLATGWAEAWAQQGCLGHSLHVAFPLRFLHGAVSQGPTKS